MHQDPPSDEWQRISRGVYVKPQSGASREALVAAISLRGSTPRFEDGDTRCPVHGGPERPGEALCSRGGQDRFSR